MGFFKSRLSIYLLVALLLFGIVATYSSQSSASNTTEEWVVKAYMWNKLLDVWARTNCEMGLDNLPKGSGPCLELPDSNFTLFSNYLKNNNKIGESYYNKAGNLSYYHVHSDTNRVGNIEGYAYSNIFGEIVFSESVYNNSPYSARGDCFGLSGSDRQPKIRRIEKIINRENIEIIFISGCAYVPLLRSFILLGDKDNEGEPIDNKPIGWDGLQIEFEEPDENDIGSVPPEIILSGCATSKKGINDYSYWSFGKNISETINNNNDVNNCLVKSFENTEDGEDGGDEFINLLETVVKWLTPSEPGDFAINKTNSGSAGYGSSLSFQVECPRGYSKIEGFFACYSSDNNGLCGGPDDATQITDPDANLPPSEPINFIPTESVEETFVKCADPRKILPTVFVKRGGGAAIQSLSLGTFSVEPEVLTKGGYVTLKGSVKNQGALIEDRAEVSLYAILTSSDSDDPSYLVKINPTTGEPTRVGNTKKWGINEINMTGLTQYQDKLYGVGTKIGKLFEINKETGEATAIGLRGFGVGETKPTTIAFANGSFWVAGNIKKKLIKVDLEGNGEIVNEDVVNFGLTAIPTIYTNDRIPVIRGLVNHKGKVYGTFTSAGYIYEINLQSGKATRIGTTNTFGQNIPRYPQEKDEDDKGITTITGLGLASNGTDLYLVGQNLNPFDKGDAERDYSGYSNFGSLYKVNPTTSVATRIGPYLNGQNINGATFFTKQAKGKLEDQTVCEIEDTVTGAKRRVSPDPTGAVFEEKMLILQDTKITFNCYYTDLTKAENDPNRRQSTEVGEFDIKLLPDRLIERNSSSIPVPGFRQLNNIIRLQLPYTNSDNYNKVSKYIIYKLDPTVEGESFINESNGVEIKKDKTNRIGWDETYFTTCLNNSNNPVCEKTIEDGFSGAYVVDAYSPSGRKVRTKVGIPPTALSGVINVSREKIYYEPSDYDDINDCETGDGKMSIDGKTGADLGIKGVTLNTPTDDFKYASKYSLYYGTGNEASDMDKRNNKLGPSVYSPTFTIFFENTRMFEDDENGDEVDRVNLFIVGENANGERLVYFRPNVFYKNDTGKKGNFCKGPRV